MIAASSHSVLGKPIEGWVAEFPLLEDLIALKETAWFNPGIAPADEALCDVGLGMADIEDASHRLQRFAPLLVRYFPELAAAGGIIESETVETPSFFGALGQHHGFMPRGRLFLKKDSHLPISGSIKARGGIYEVLKRAETLALAEGLIREGDDYSQLDSDDARKFFSGYSVMVGSTGNLGLSIGIMSARIGFRTTVHMSADARRWKKEKLRECGVEVVEHAGDYSAAVAQGRKDAEADPTCHFVDDEHSRDLFLGYAVAALRLKPQLAKQGIVVDEDHPLFVYLPCGVGGGPGGVAFGLKLLFGDHVHCVFVEPTQSPCMLLGVYTGRHDEISVQDFGIPNRTIADGLAVGRASSFIGRAVQRLVDGYVTVQDQELLDLLSILRDSEGVELEPSAIAGGQGPGRVLTNEAYLTRMGLDGQKLAAATHLLWLTGGSMVPAEEMASYFKRAS
ncbi:D-serine ammonia-lyase [Pseudaminobacter arsenicus]|uniref:Probable D-serine dehydratase n=1 Tax=Borborobacter arsenicus TaxID=1851146 RepID=A0A432V7I0_9HYPH|nr:D-serine ammonia-lyase [Pseudaminobacter arsenicus]RUM98114.1 D-serine ammonia-lyase [Pseudaminobacter arsenicus]